MNEEFSVSKEAGTLPEGTNQTGRLAVDCMKLDLASLKSTMAFIEAFKASGRKLHVLLCNAGLAMLPRSKERSHTVPTPIIDDSRQTG